MNKGLRAVAMLTLTCFLTTQCVSAGPVAGIEITGGRELPTYLSIDVPADLGTVDALYEAPASASPQFILHIQNAHVNYQAQMKIKQLLQYMNKKYGFQTIFVEGASEKLDPDYLRLFPDQERNMKLCDELAKQGELTGAELFLMEQSGATHNAPRATEGGTEKSLSAPVEALGIEQTALYKANYDALKKVFGAETDVTRFFKGFDTKLDKVASKTFTSETRELIADWKRFEQGRREFMPFVRSLTVKSKKILKIDLESLFAQVGWPQISRLLVIQQMEKELDKTKGLEEKAKLAAMLRTLGVTKELIATIESFNEGSIAVGKSATEVSPREVLERLAREAGPQGFKFSDYPAFSLFAGYVTLRSELDAKVLFEEIEYLFTQMLDKLAEEPKQKELLALYRDGELLRKLLHLELNRAQWRQAVAGKDRIAAPSLVARLKDAVIASGDASVKKDQEVMPKAFGSKMDELYTAGLEFYDFAHQREAVFYKEMQSQMAEKKITKAILITGGFHTDGMSDLFRDNAVSYGIVTPRLSERSDENLYQKIMLRKGAGTFETSYLEAILSMVSGKVVFDSGGNGDITSIINEFKRISGLSDFGQVKGALMAAAQTAHEQGKVSLLLDGNGKQQYAIEESAEGNQFRLVPFAAPASVEKTVVDGLIKVEAGTLDGTAATRIDETDAARSEARKTKKEIADNYQARKFWGNVGTLLLGGIAAVAAFRGVFALIAGEPSSAANPTAALAYSALDRFVAAPIAAFASLAPAIVAFFLVRIIVGTLWELYNEKVYHGDLKKIGHALAAVAMFGLATLTGRGGTLGESISEPTAPAVVQEAAISDIKVREVKFGSVTRKAEAKAAALATAVAAPVAITTNAPNAKITIKDYAVRRNGTAVVVFTVEALQPVTVDDLYVSAFDQVGGPATGRTENLVDSGGYELSEEEFLPVYVVIELPEEKKQGFFRPSGDINTRSEARDLKKLESDAAKAVFEARTIINELSDRATIIPKRAALDAFLNANGNIRVARLAVDAGMMLTAVRTYRKSIEDLIALLKTVKMEKEAGEAAEAIAILDRFIGSVTQEELSAARSEARGFSEIVKELLENPRDPWMRADTDVAKAANARLGLLAQTLDGQKHSGTSIFATAEIFSNLVRFEVVASNRIFRFWNRIFAPLFVLSQYRRDVAQLRQVLSAGRPSEGEISLTLAKFDHAMAEWRKESIRGLGGQVRGTRSRTGAVRAEAREKKGLRVDIFFPILFGAATFAVVWHYLFLAAADLAMNYAARLIGTGALAMIAGIGVVLVTLGSIFLIAGGVIAAETVKGWLRPRQNRLWSRPEIFIRKGLTTLKDPLVYRVLGLRMQIGWLRFQESFRNKIEIAKLKTQIRQAEGEIEQIKQEMGFRSEAGKIVISPVQRNEMLNILESAKRKKLPWTNGILSERLGADVNEDNLYQKTEGMISRMNDEAFWRFLDKLATEINPTYELVGYDLPNSQFKAFAEWMRGVDPTWERIDPALAKDLRIHEEGGLLDILLSQAAEAGISRSQALEVLRNAYSDENLKRFANLYAQSVEELRETIIHEMSSKMAKQMLLAPSVRVTSDQGNRSLPANVILDALRNETPPFQAAPAEAMVELGQVKVETGDDLVTTVVVYAKNGQAWNADVKNTFTPELLKALLTLYGEAGFSIAEGPAEWIVPAGFVEAPSPDSVLAGESGVFFQVPKIRAEARSEAAVQAEIQKARKQYEDLTTPDWFDAKAATDVTRRIAELEGELAAIQHPEAAAAIDEVIELVGSSPDVLPILRDQRISLSRRASAGVPVLAVEYQTDGGSRFIDISGILAGTVGLVRGKVAIGVKDFNVPWIEFQDAQGLGYIPLDRSVADWMNFRTPEAPSILRLTPADTNPFTRSEARGITLEDVAALREAISGYRQAWSAADRQGMRKATSDFLFDLGQILFYSPNTASPEILENVASMLSQDALPLLERSMRDRDPDEKAQAEEAYDVVADFLWSHQVVFKNKKVNLDPVMSHLMHGAVVRSRILQEKSAMDRQAESLFNANLALREYAGAEILFERVNENTVMFLRDPKTDKRVRIETDLSARYRRAPFQDALDAVRQARSEARGIQLTRIRGKKILVGDQQVDIPTEIGLRDGGNAVALERFSVVGEKDESGELKTRVTYKVLRQGKELRGKEQKDPATLDVVLGANLVPNVGKMDLPDKQASDLIRAWISVINKAKQKFDVPSIREALKPVLSAEGPSDIDGLIAEIREKGAAEADVRAEMRSVVEERQTLADAAGKALAPELRAWYEQNNPEFGTTLLESVLWGIVTPADGVSVEKVSIIVAVMKAYYDAKNSRKFDRAVFLKNVQSILDAHPAFSVSLESGATIKHLTEMPSDQELDALGLRLLMNPNKEMIWVYTREASLDIADLKDRIKGVEEDLNGAVKVTTKLKLVEATTMNLASQIKTAASRAAQRTGKLATIQVEKDSDLQTKLAKSEIMGNLLSTEKAPSLTGLQDWVAMRLSGHSDRHAKPEHLAIVADLLGKEFGAGVVKIIDGSLELDNKVLAALETVLSALIAQKATSVAA